MRGSGDWVYDHMGWIFGGAIALLLALAVWAIVNSEDDSKRFMVECMADGHKRYECEGLYRGAHPPSPPPVVVPVPVHH